MNIELTPAAIARMRHFLAASPQAAGIRFGVRKTGCSGYAYVVDVAADIDVAHDRIIERDGLRLIVDAASAPLLDGTRIDFARQGLNAAFVFRNPNQTGQCGCGESFTVDPAAAA